MVQLEDSMIYVKLVDEIWSLKLVKFYIVHKYKILDYINSCISIKCIEDLVLAMIFVNLTKKAKMVINSNTLS